MFSDSLLRRLLALAVVALAIVVTISAIPAYAQVHSQTSMAVSESHQDPQMYEDPEIKLIIPEGWRKWSEAEIERSASTDSLGNSISQVRQRLVLEKNKYILGLAYHTDHASGVEGGRFIEAFNIPWPGLDDVWTCSGYLREYSYPASRNLIFVSLTVSTGDEKARENCGIKKDLGAWVEKDGKKQYDYGDSRWFGGYFRAKYAGYFFGGEAEGCGLKAYTLTTLAKTPDQLPIANIPGQDNNPTLEKIIQEAIDIVNAIQYKRCSPF